MSISILNRKFPGSARGLGGAGGATIRPGIPVSQKGDAQEILTLEPFIEGVREGVEGAGWELSGLQKTTSHQFEGRWEGESTRSAYLFFHRADLPDWVSIDVYLDETSRGLKGNLALVLDGPPLGRVGRVHDTLARLSAAARRALPEGYRTPLTVRFRLLDDHAGPEEAETEYRFKIRIPSSALKVGHSGLVALAGTAAGAFEALLEDSELRSAVGPE